MATEDPYKQRMLAYLEADFMPPSNPNAMPKHEVRMAHAVEYSAHHLGKISKSLERIAAALEKISEKP
jgi:hypothetical protein